MRITRSIASKLIYPVALCSVVFAGTASAQNARRSTVVTFNAPVRLPTITLPAGTYTFELPARSDNVDIVAIFNDHGRFIALAEVTPTTRATAGPTAVLVDESPAAPPRVTAVYYAGSTSGYQFRYAGPSGTLAAKANKK